MTDSIKTRDKGWHNRLLKASGFTERMGKKKKNTKNKILRWVECGTWRKRGITHDRRAPGLGAQGQVKTENREKAQRATGKSGFARVSYERAERLPTRNWTPVSGVQGDTDAGTFDLQVAAETMSARGRAGHGSRRCRHLGRGRGNGSPRVISKSIRERRGDSQHWPRRAFLGRKRIRQLRLPHTEKNPVSPHLAL